MGEISVQRNTSDVANSGGTQAPGTNFASLTAAFVRNLNNRRMNAGDVASDADHEIDDLSGSIELTAVGTITFSRESGSKVANHRFTWESWEYTGVAAGVNEFIVRSRNTVTLTGESTTATLDNTPTNIDDCIPFITGISVDSTQDDADAGTAIAWISGSNTLNIKRGSGSNNTVIVQVVTVEFTGSNWQVAHGRSNSNNADTGTITLRDNADGVSAGGGDIGNWAQAVIFHQQKANSANGVDDAIADTSAAYRNGAGTTMVDWAFQAQHLSSVADEEHFVHVLKHADMVVTRFTSTGSAEGANNVDITSASLTDLAAAACEISASSSGTGTGYGRGWKSGRLTSTTNFEHWAHKSGNTIDAAIQVIDLAGIAVVTIHVYTYIMRGGFVTPDWTEVGSKYNWAELANAFTWSELAAGPVPDEDVRQINIDRKSADVFNRLTIGRASGILDNVFAQYSPLSGTSGINVNQVLTVKVIDTITKNSTVTQSIFGLFSGFIDTARVVPGEGNKIIEFSASDRAKLFRRTIQTSLQVDTKTNSLFGVILDAAGVEAADRTIDPQMKDDIPFAWLDNISAGEALDQIMRSGAHLMYIDGKGKFNAKSRSSEQFASPLSSHENFFDLDFAITEEGIINDAIITGQPRKVSTSVNTVAFIEDNPSIIAGGSLNFFLEFLDPDTRDPTPVQSLITPVASQDFRLFSDENETGTDLTSAAGVVVTPFATTALISVTNSGDVSAFLTHFQLRGNAIQRRSPFLVQIQVASSQALYGVRGFGLRTDLTEKVTFVKNYAEFIVAQKKDPSQAISFGLKNENPAMLQLDILEKVTLVESNTGISGDWVIKSVRDQLSFVRGTEHIRTFEVEQAQDAFFVLDVDKLDIGILGF